MKNLQAYFYSLMLVLLVTMTSCELVGDIFEAGMWTALIVIVLVIILVVWLFKKIRR